MPHTRASAGSAGLRSTAEIVLDALNEGFLTVGPGSVVRFANRRAGEQFGCAPGELVGAHIDALVPGVAPVRSDRPRADPDPLAPALGFHTRARRRDGAEFPVAVALTPLPDGAVLVSVRSTALERGALIGAEPEVDRGLIDSLDVPVVVLDRSGTVTAINRAWERVFQPYEPGADRGVASDYLDVCCRVTGPYSEEAATVERGVCAVLNGTLGRFTAECPFRVDGEIRWYQIRVAALAGRVPGATVAHWDVTDLRRTEHALRESEQRFRAVVESQTEQVCRFRSDGTLTFVNSAYCRYFGRRADELIGRPFWTLVADTDTEPVRQNLASIAPEHPVATVEHRVLASNGEVRWQQWTNRGLFDAGGRLIEFQSVGRDVTDRKNSEEQTRQSEERFRDLFQNAPLATVCWRAEGDDFVLADSNEAAKNLYSDGVNQAIGWKLSEVHATRPEHRANIARCYRERTPFTAEFCWPEMPWGEPDGCAEVLVSYSFVPPNLVMSALQVVTERKQQERALRASEERLRRVLSALREGVVSVDPDGRVRTCNESAMRLFGERPDGLIGASLTERIGLALREDGRPLSPDLFPWEVVRRTDALSAGGTFLAAPARGPFVRLMISAHALPAEPNEPRPVVVSFTDITARWHAEEQLRQHKAELAHVARCSLVGEMAAVLAHELNQPLTAVINYCRGSVLRLRAGAADAAEIVEGLNLAVGQAERAAGIVHRVREFMRKREPQRAATQINDVVQEALALVGPELRHHGIRVVPRLGAELPLIQADRIQIEQVLLNLIRNAGEALTNLPVIERRIVIETGATGASVCVRVIDSGLGFDAEGLRRVFEPFYTTKKQGMGLGLTISRGIIESHGGRLTLAPAFPRGAGFSFTLPITPEPPAPGPTESAG